MKKWIAYVKLTNLVAEFEFTASDQENAHKRVHEIWPGKSFFVKEKSV